MVTEEDSQDCFPQMRSFSKAKGERVHSLFDVKVDFIQSQMNILKCCSYDNFLKNDPGETRDLLINPSKIDLDKAAKLMARLDELMEGNAREPRRCQKIAILRFFLKKCFFRL